MTKRIIKRIVTTTTISLDEESLKSLVREYLGDGVEEVRFETFGESGIEAIAVMRLVKEVVE